MEGGVRDTEVEETDCSFGGDGLANARHGAPGGMKEGAATSRRNVLRDHVPDEMGLSGARLSYDIEMRTPVPLSYAEENAGVAVVRLAYVGDAVVRIVAHTSDCAGSGRRTQCGHLRHSVRPLRPL